MATIHHDCDADLSLLADQSIAVVGYGNQGRSWALNLRDSGFDVRVCVRADASREQAAADGFALGAIADASRADVICVLVPDDAIPGLGILPREASLVVLASGYCLAFGRFDALADVGLVAPRMLGPEVRRCYEEGVGFISAVGVHRDRSGRALARTLAVARAIGGTRQGAIEMTPMQEAVLDLSVEQVLSPALTFVNAAFVGCMLEQGIPLEAVMTELFLSGEVERSYRLLREEGFVRQLAYHSPTSQYGQLSRRGRFDHLDVVGTMRELTAEIVSGRFAEEWEAESQAGHPRLEALRAAHAGPALRAFEETVRRQLGPRASRGHEAGRV